MDTFLPCRASYKAGQKTPLTFSSVTLPSLRASRWAQIALPVLPAQPLQLLVARARSPTR